MTRFTTETKQHSYSKIYIFESLENWQNTWSTVW